MSPSCGASISGRVHEGLEDVSERVRKVLLWDWLAVDTILMFAKIPTHVLQAASC